MIGSRARRPLLVTAMVLGAAVLIGGAAVGGYAVTDAVRSPVKPTPSSSAPALPSSVAGATSVPSVAAAPSGAPAVAAAVARVLAPLRNSAALGSRLTAQVLDATDGTSLYARQATLPVAPASVAKLLTATAVLTEYAPTTRFTTRVVAGPGTAVTLVGGGDPTLTGAAAGKPGRYAGAARISDLAAQLHRAGLHPSRIYVDDSLYSGPTVSPSWDPGDAPSSYGAPITALMVDGGRARPTATQRSATPDLAAGHALAAALGTPSLAVARRTATPGARTVAQVRSAMLSTLVEQMLQYSDNVIAETLGRHVAIAEHQPASFRGAVTAIRTVLRRLGVDVGTGMVDASGLAARDRLSARTLAEVLRLDAGAAHPALHVVLAGLPVAAWSGTLTDRYLSGAARSGAGVVRAKTGTLTGVSTLAGLARDDSGRLLIFVFMAGRVPATPAAEAALDRLAAAVARCGCTR